MSTLKFRDPVDGNWKLLLGTGPAGPAGPQGDPGATGPTGPPGASTNIFRFRAKTGTTGDPGAGFVRWNNTDQDASTVLAIDYLDQDNLNVVLGLTAITSGNEIYLQDYDNSANYQNWRVTGAGTDMTGWWEFPVTLIASAGTGATNFANGAMLAARVLRPGVPGPGVATGGTANQALVKIDSTNYNTKWADVLLSAQARTITVSTTAPSSPAVNDLWVDTT